MRSEAPEPKEPVAEAQAILMDALEVAHRIPYAFERDRVLLGVAAGFAQSGETDAALRVATTVTKAPLRDQAYFLAVHALMKDDHVEEAGVILARMRQPELYTGAAAPVLAALVRRGQREEALRLHESIPTPGGRRRVWEYIGVQADGPGDIEPVMQLVDGLVDEDERDWALAGIARGLAKRGRVARAVDITAQISSEEARASAQWGIAAGQARHGDLGGALLTASELPPHREARTAAVAEIAKAYVAMGDAEGALNMADLLADAEARICVLRAVAVKQAASGDAAAGYRTSLRIDEAAQRSRAQIEVARGRARSGDTTGVLRVAATIREEALRSRMLVEVALAQAAAGAVEGAERTMARVPELRGMKATVSSEIASAHARAGDADAAVAMADEFAQPSERAVVLLGAARGALERANKIDVPDTEVVCGRPTRTVDLLLRPVGMERLIEGLYARS